MCTYSRKLKNHFIDGVEKLCRLCLGEVGETPVPVFTEGIDVCSSLPFRIMMCIGIQLTYDVDLPSAICKLCYEQLERCYTFRKKCQNSYSRLKSHLRAVNNRKYAQMRKDTVKQSKAQLQLVSDYCGNGLMEFGTNTIYSVMKTENLIENFVQCDDSNSFLEAKVEVPQDNKEHVLNCNESVDVENVVLAPSNEEMPKRNDLISDENVKILQQFNEDQVQNKVTDSELSTICTTVDVQEDAAPQSEISTFLFTILTELGILQKHEDGVELKDDVKSLELEIDDDNVISLELVEEDEPVQMVSSQEIKSDDNEDTIIDKLDDALIEFIRGEQIKLPQSAADTNPNTESDEEEAVSKESDGGASGGVGPLGTVCGECGKRFSTRGSLRRHLRVHSGEKPHLCKECGKRFAQRAVLNRHRFLHLERRPFECAQCAKGFTQRSGLAAHLRAHRPPAARPLQLHRCPHCVKVFLYQSGLSRHMSAHNGRVYVCGACERHFKDKSSLLRHLKNAHAADNTPT